MLIDDDFDAGRIGSVDVRYRYGNGMRNNDNFVAVMVSYILLF